MKNMTRTARTKSVHRHERVPNEATTWSELKPTFQNKFTSKKVKSDDTVGRMDKGHNRVQESKISSNDLAVTEGLRKQTEIVSKMSKKNWRNGKVKEQEKKIWIHFASSEKASKKINKAVLEKNAKKVKKTVNGTNQTFKNPRKLHIANEDANSSTVSPIDTLVNAKKRKKMVNRELENVNGTNQTLKRQKKRHIENDNVNSSTISPVDTQTQVNSKKRKKTKKKMTEGPSPGEPTQNDEKLGLKKKQKNKKMKEFRLSGETMDLPTPSVEILTIKKKKKQNKQSLTLVEGQGAENEGCVSQEPSTNSDTTKQDNRERRKNRWRLKRLKQRKEKGMLLLSEKVERKLQMLRKALQKTGKPIEEIKTIMRKERRRKELQHRKEQTKTCYNCRKPGHTVSDCRAILRDNQQSMGICFRCGSTEHILNKCSQPRNDGSLPFAKCFVCNGQGHLSGQCEKNSRGVFPKGGACSICNSINHMRKDCPTLMKDEDEPKTVVHRFTDIGSVDADVLEEIKIPKQKKNKIVKF